MSLKRERAKCEICGLEIDKDNLEIRNRRYYHSKCLNELIEKEREYKRNALKVIGLGSAVATVTFLGMNKFASAVNLIPRNGGNFQKSFVLPQLYTDPLTPQPGEMWYRMDNGVFVYHDGIDKRNIYSNRYLHETTVSSKGIINGLSDIPNDGADFGPDTTLGVTAPGQYGPPYTQTSGILEAVNYSYKGSNPVNIPIKLLTGLFTISPDATLYKVNTSAPFTGAPEYAIVPLPTQVPGTAPIQNIIIHGSGGLINAGGVNRPPVNLDSRTVIDVSHVSAPLGSTVMTFAWDRSVYTSGTNAIDVRDFVILQAVPQASGENIVGGCEFWSSWDSIALNIGILSLNSFFSTVFPSPDEIGFAIDGGYGDVSWIDGLSIYANYIGAIFGAHAHVGTYVNNSCYYGLIPESRHGIDIIRYDAVGNIYNIYQNTTFNGSVRIFLIDGEDYSAVSSSANQLIADVYVESGSYGSYSSVEIENFHMEYGSGSPNPRLPIIQNKGTGYYVTVKHIESQPSSAAGITAGTIQPYVIEYGTNYKKMVFQFNDYENDTATDQTVNFPTNSASHSNSLIFIATSVMTGNTTGLITSASTTGITITTPNSTKKYNGIIIIEGY